MQVTKNKNERVSKPVKGNFISLIRKSKKEVVEDDKEKTVEVEEPIEVLTVVDQDDNVIATFSVHDHGPRYWFKAHQYATNFSSLEQILRVKEFSE